MTGQSIQQETICYQWFKQRLILSVSKPSISEWSQIKEDTADPSVPAREFNLKAYAAITWQKDPASLGLKPRLTNHRSQAARTATLPIAPQRQQWRLESRTTWHSWRHYAETLQLFKILKQTNYILHLQFVKFSTATPEKCSVILPLFGHFGTMAWDGPNLHVQWLYI